MGEEFKNYSSAKKHSLMKLVRHIAFIILLVDCTVGRGQNNGNNLPQPENAILSIQAAYQIPPYHPWNSFRFDNKRWNNIKPGSKIALSKVQQQLVLEAELNGNEEATQTLPFRRLERIRYVNIHLDNKVISSLLAVIKNNKNLKIIEIIEPDNSNAVEELNIPWPVMNNIEALIVRKNFRKLAPSIGRLKKLKFLSLQSVSLEKLPLEIGNLSELLDLELTGTSADCLKNLDSLLVSRDETSLLNRLTDLPSSLAKLNKLKSLTIHSAGMIQFPMVFYSLFKLEQVELYTPNIQSIVDTSKQAFKNSLLRQQQVNLLMGKPKDFAWPASHLNLNQCILINSDNCLKWLNLRYSADDASTILLFKSNIDSALLYSLQHFNKYWNYVIVPNKKFIFNSSPLFLSEYCTFCNRIQILKFDPNDNIDPVKSYHKIVDRASGKKIELLQGLWYKDTFIKGFPIANTELEIGDTSITHTAIQIDTGKAYKFIRSSSLPAFIPKDFNLLIDTNNFDAFQFIPTAHSLVVTQRKDKSVSNTIASSLRYTNNQLQGITLDYFPDNIAQGLPKLLYANTMTFTTFSTKRNNEISYIRYYSRRPTDWEYLDWDTSRIKPQVDIFRWNIYTGINRAFEYNSKKFHIPNVRSVALNVIKETDVPMKVTASFPGAGEKIERLQVSGLSRGDTLEIGFLSGMANKKLELSCKSFLLQTALENNRYLISILKSIVIDSCDYKYSWRNLKDTTIYLGSNNTLPTKIPSAIEEIFFDSCKILPYVISRIPKLNVISCNGVQDVSIIDSFARREKPLTIILKNGCGISTLKGLSSLGGNVKLIIEDSVSLKAAFVYLQKSPVYLDLYADAQTVGYSLVGFAKFASKLKSLHLYNVPEDAPLPDSIIALLEGLPDNKARIFIENKSPTYARDISEG